MSSVLLWRNYEAASRKRNMIDFGMFPTGTDLTWIRNNPDLGAEPIVVAFSTTPTFDGADGDIQSFVMTADVNSSTFLWGGSASPAVGSTLSIRLMQDATGGWRFVFPTNVRLEPTYSIDPHATTVIHFMFLDSMWEPIYPPVINPTP